ncbi:hypothetical protein MP638_001359 [Amoeboaphelidium occidentale]|nr:hypothetical protein MP638_001359 [Amoeboaphelidium occidentale]
MQQPTIDDYLAYNPPTLVAAKKHTSHKTSYPSNPRTDDIELTKWESFAQNALDYANAIRNQLAAHPMKVPLPQVTMMPYIRSEVEMYALMMKYVVTPIEDLCGVVFNKQFTIGSVSGLLGLAPDAGIIYYPKDDARDEITYCAIEYKTCYAFPTVNGGDLVAAFNEERARQEPQPSCMPTRQSGIARPNNAMTKLSTADSTKVSRVVAQIWGYMTVNHLKYGILTTLNDTYFFRRVEHQVGSASKLEVSHCLSTGLSQLPFMTAWLYIISLAVESHTYASPYTSPAMSRKMIKKGDPYTVQEVSLSDIYFTQAGPLNLVSRANIGSSKSPRIVHVKFFDVSKDENASEKFHCELAAYKKLESLQGTTVPKLYGSFIASGFLYGLFLEPCGDEITQQIFEERRALIKTLFVQIHSCGVAHGDIACRNIMVDGANKIKIIDFDSSYLQTDETDLEIWNEKVKADLDTFQ